MKFACVLLIALFATCALAQRTRKGACPKVTTSPSPFDFNRFTGIWYGLYKLPFGPTANYTCVYGRYTHPTPETFNIQLGGVDASGNPAENPVYPGTAVSGKVARIDTRVAPNFVIPYYPLKTDYKNFASFYGCYKINETHSGEVVFAMGRKRNPSQSIKDKAIKTFKDQGISLEGLVPNDQNNCPKVTA